MPTLSQFFISLFLSSLSVCTAQESAQVKTIFKLDGWSRGPFEGQKSVSCLTIYSDGQIKYFHRWNSGRVRVDAKTGQKSLQEQTVSVESQLTRTELFEFSGFLESDMVKGLAESFVVPQSHIDYSESTAIHIIHTNGENAISINGYGAAGLEGRSRLPGVLIVLMDKIEEIEKAAAIKGKSAKFSSDCAEARE